MDARRWALRAAVMGALFSTGCDWFNAKPTARPENKPPEQPAEPPIVVDAPPPAAEPAIPVADEHIDSQVADYIARVDDLAARVGAERTELSNPRRPRASGAAVAEHRTSIEPFDPERAGGDSTTGAARDAEHGPGSDDATPRAPVLTGVSVRAADAADSAASAVTPTRAAPPPAMNTPISSGAAPAGGLSALLDALPDARENPSFRQQLDQRIAQVVAGEHEAARSPLTLVTNEQQMVASRLIEALIAVRDGHLGDPAAANSAALNAIEQLSDELRRGSDLRLPTLAICSAVSGFGQYQPIDPPVFTAGAESEFVVYVEVRDFVSEKETDGMYRTCFDLRTAILNRSGDVALDFTDSDVVDRCRNRRSDCFIPRLVRLPATLSPGEHVVKVSVTDKLGRKVAENRATFRVVVGR